MAVDIAEKLEALLGLRVVLEIARHGWTIPKLAKETGVPLSTLQKICKGDGKQPSVWTIRALAGTLHVSMDYLCGLSDTPTPLRDPGEG